MIVQPTQINYVPDLTGNTDNLNEIVSDPNLDRWFIDHEGKAICLTKINGEFENTTAGRGILQRSSNNTIRRTKMTDSGTLKTKN